MVVSKAWTNPRLRGGRVKHPYRSWRTRRSMFALVILGSLATSGAAFAVPASASGVASDQSQISQLEARITSQGAALQQLVARSNETQGQLSTLQEKLSTERQQLLTYQANEAVAASNLRKLAIQEYVDGPASAAQVPASGSSLVARADSAMVEGEYVRIAGLNVAQAMQNYSLDAKLVATTAAATQNLSNEAQKTVSALAAQRQAAVAALAADETTLNQVKGNLAQLLAAAQAKQAAEQLAAERALVARVVAAQAAQAQAARAAAASATSRPPVAEPPATAPPTAQLGEPLTVAPVFQAPAAVAQSPAVQSPVVSAAGYANPLRGVSALHPERIDQGVDFSGYGPIYAIGDGVVLSTFNGGWPGGTFISYRLTSGPAAGLTVYAAEDIFPTVQVGETVTPGTVLGTLYEGPAGMETGWANGGSGSTMAYGAGQFGGSNTTMFGYNFSLLLQSVGAPGGVMENSVPTGSLPSGWPNW